MFMYHKCTNMTLLDVTCVDCGENGHYTKKYFKCKLFEDDSADQGRYLINHKPNYHYKYYFHASSGNKHQKAQAEP
jgi:hypothetical protein